MGIFTVDKPSFTAKLIQKEIDNTLNAISLTERNIRIDTINLEMLRERLLELTNDLTLISNKK
jgi:hypothetical protein